jgi:uncharacterized membrane protein SpoIIM required for sporulation
MKVAQLLEKRRQNWHELENLCVRVGSLSAAENSRFSSLYRSVCADLALAESYQLPHNTVQYLHRLTGKAHNLLYRRRRFDLQTVMDVLFQDVPQQIFRDRAVQVAFFVFWVLFIMSAALAYFKVQFPGYAEAMMGPEMLAQLEGSFKGMRQRTYEENITMAGLYIWNNTGIGLKVFSWGLLVIPGLFELATNALVLGAAFGFMARPENSEAGKNFYHFVTAHGPFELTAIVLSAGAGLKLGLSWIAPGNLARVDSMRKVGREALPIMGAAAIMFFLAAMIEGFISPFDFTQLPWLDQLSENVREAINHGIKATISVISTILLMFYFVVLGYPKEEAAGATG